MEFFNPKSMNWYKPTNLEPKAFKCGYCGNNVSSEKGLKLGEHQDASGKQVGGVFICPSCKGPTFISHEQEQFPKPILGNPVSKVPHGLYELYEEARKCTGQGCYTASVLICRKILMNIAVEQGAGEGKKFIEYVDYLSNTGYIPPNGRHWVDHIRKKGNEATHEIQLMEQSDAAEILIFSEMLLKFVYEFPNMVSKDT